MKTFIAYFTSFIFLFVFVIFIAIAASAKLWLAIISFGGICILWQLLKRVIDWCSPSIEEEL